MTQDQFTRQISLQVKQSITEELDLFRQEQAKILCDALKEVLPEMEEIIVQNIFSKLDAGEETKTPESDSGSGKLSPDFPLQIPQPRTMQIPQTSIITCSGQVSDAPRLLRAQKYKVSMCPDIPYRKQITGVLPIMPSEGKALYTKKSCGGSGKQCPNLSICSSLSKGSYFTVSH